MAAWRRGVGRNGVSMAAVDREAVARLAYQLYEQRGKASGRELDDWLKAEAILRQGGGGPSAGLADTGQLRDHLRPPSRAKVTGDVGQAVTAKQSELRGE